MTDHVKSKAMQRAHDHARQVADRLIAALKEGTAPWQQPWTQCKGQALPYNASTGKPYRGGNTLWLMMQGRSDPRWLTYRQATEAGAQVRKGEHGTPIEYWMRSERRPVKDKDGKPAKDANGKQRYQTVELDRPKCMHFTVFSAEQVDGLPPLPQKEPAPEWQRNERVEAILKNSGARILHASGNEAFYRPSTDTITLPERGQFKDADGFGATALHELSHWTGHESRLNRGPAHAFGSPDYAKEELRAEIGSMMLGDRLGVGHSPDADGDGQHAAYVASWIKALQDDPREIFRAAADAEKINDYVMRFDPKRQREREAQGDANGVTPLTAEDRARWTKDAWKADPALHASPEPWSGKGGGELWKAGHEADDGDREMEMG